MVLLASCTTMWSPPGLTRKNPRVPFALSRARRVCSCVWMLFACAAETDDARSTRMMNSLGREVLGTTSGLWCPRRSRVSRMRPVSTAPSNCTVSSVPPRKSMPYRGPGFQIRIAESTERMRENAIQYFRIDMKS